MERLHFINYDAIGELELKNTGHGVIVNGFDKWPSELRPYIQGGSLGAKYMLHQFHFHWAVQNDAGSEHTLNGLHYPVELHFVHIRQGLELPEALKESDGIAAVGVFYQIGMGKNANKAMAGLEKPLEHVIKKNSTTQLSDYSPSMHLPKNIGDFFRYNGSLTTPNCEEAVIWTLMANPVQITKEQLDLLRAVHSLTDDQPLKEGSYARSIRPLNGRRIQVRSSALEQLKKRRKERKHY